MEAAVKQEPSYPAREMDIKQKKTIALQTIRGTHSITDIAKENKVSRKFVYKQNDKAIQAVDDIFNEPEPENEKNKKDKNKCYYPMPKTFYLFNLNPKYYWCISALTTARDS